MKEGCLMSKTNQEKFEFGIYTFGEIIPDPITGKIFLRKSVFKISLRQRS